jgi:hypothetical protein
MAGLSGNLMSKLLDASARLTLALAQSAALVAVILLFAAARALGAPAADAATSNTAAEAGTSNKTAGDAKAIFRKMTDYIGGQKAVSARYDSDIEVVTTEGQKISFASSGRLLIERPDKLRVSRTGGYADVEMVFDGKKLDILAKDQNRYAEIDAPGTVGQLVERIRDQSEASLPGADLFSATAYDDMTKDLTDASHIGQGVINGVECEHLAFRSPEADWQLWVQAGDNPIPRKFVITSKTVTAQPQYTMQINDWRTDVTAGASDFAFIPPPGAVKVAVAELKKTDEVPAGVAPGTMAGRK